MVIGTYAKFMPRELSSPAQLEGAQKPDSTSNAFAPMRTGGAKAASFSNVLDQAVSGINDKMQTAQTEQTKLLTGETNNVHQAMIAVQEASVAFSLMVEVRNKLVESYQEIMRMQV